MSTPEVALESSNRWITDVTSKVVSEGANR